MSGTDTITAGAVHAALTHAATQAKGGGTMAVVTLVGWLLTESLGAYMLRGWIISGGLRQRGTRPDGISLPVLFGHLGLAATGLVCWVAFLLTGWAVPAWLAIGFLAPAIGLGISTVTVWTPYPTRGASPAAGPARTAASISNEAMARALDDEHLTDRLVDDMLANVLATGSVRAPGSNRRALALIPAAHGVLAIATFLFAMLTVVAAAT